MSVYNFIFTFFSRPIEYGGTAVLQQLLPTDDFFFRVRCFTFCQCILNIDSVLVNYSMAQHFYYLIVKITVGNHPFSSVI